MGTRTSTHTGRGTDWNKARTGEGKKRKRQKWEWEWEREADKAVVYVILEGNQRKKTGARDVCLLLHTRRREST